MTTKKNQMMAFITLEDLFGTVEIIVFPKIYEQYKSLLEEDAKVFFKGRVSAEEDKDGKLICEQLAPFDAVRRELWIQFATKADYVSREDEVFEAVSKCRGTDSVVIYVADIKAVKRLPADKNVQIEEASLEYFKTLFGNDNVKVVEKTIEMR